MKRWLRALLWSLLAAPAASCAGGQTGEPAAAACDGTRTLLASDEWGGLTVATRAHAFEGHYSAPLAWFEKSVTSPTQTPVALDDNIAIDIGYEGADAQQICDGQLQIPMRVDVRTTASGIHESGVGQLLLTSPAPSGGALDLQGVDATILVLLPGVANGAPPSGTVVPTEGGAPGGWAEFPAPESAAGAGSVGTVGGAGGAGGASP